MLDMRKKMILIITVAILLLSQVAPAFAWSRTGARDYANTWWNGRNSAWNNFDHNCTNFVSQALKSGGARPFDESGSYQWWMKKNWLGQWTWRKEWTVANDFFNYIVHDTSYRFIGNYDHVSGGWPAPPSYNSGFKLADFTSFDWTKNGIFNHTNIITVLNGDDPNSSYSGTLANQHTSNRKHAIWHLKPYNSSWSTTHIKAFGLN